MPSWMALKAALVCRINCRDSLQSTPRRFGVIRRLPNWPGKRYTHSLSLDVVQAPSVEWEGDKACRNRFRLSHTRRWKSG